MQEIPLPYFSDARNYAASICDEPGLIWYHNGQDAKETEWLSAWPSQYFEYRGNDQIIVTSHDGHTRTVHQDWFEFLKRQKLPLQAHPKIKFTGGLAGHFSYDLGLELLNIVSRHSDPTQTLAVVGLYHWCIHVDHTAEEALLLIQPDCPEQIQQYLCALKFETKHSTKAEIPSSKDKNPAEWICRMSPTTYKNSFNKIKKYIVEGDAYQINLTRQWYKNNNSFHDWSVYSELCKAMPAPFSVFQRCNDHSLLSVSPERFIQISNNKILTQPIKGTRPRAQDPVQDNANRVELSKSEKDKAENLMIVDLLRNDIAKNATPGSVNVDKLFQIQSFKNVHHLVSTISAELKANHHPLDVLRDAFPGGSITGAPKKRAMEIIDELETVLRGNYCGCSFYLGANNELDSNILIRTVTMTDSTLTCSGGGGIVFDSTHQEEWDESAIKVEKILTTLS